MSGEPSNHSTADRLKAVRVRLGITQSAAAKACGINRASWNDMEAGRREPTLDRLWGIASKLGVDPYELDPRFMSTRMARQTLVRAALDRAIADPPKGRKPKG